ncbi:MAG: hypothetical protein KAT16_03160 [Candidatus Heimdallarchaeota archaeon]|nr:hypothetical protein [Candidatus Heimdallarchaeota archaeon]
MSKNTEIIKEKVIVLIPYRYFIAIGFTALLLWFHLLFFPAWQLYFLPAVLGGLIIRDKAIRGFLVGFVGMSLALLLYMNFALFTAVEAVETLVGAAVGVGGLGFLVHIIILLILASFSGLGGIIGTYIYPLFPFYEKLGLEVKF